MTRTLSRLALSFFLITAAQACSGPEAPPPAAETPMVSEEQVEEVLAEYVDKDRGVTADKSDIGICGYAPACPTGYAPVYVSCNSTCQAVYGYDCFFGHNYVVCTPVPASGDVSANPETVNINIDVTSTGTSEICWDVDDVTTGEVWVSMDGAPESLFARDPSGCSSAPWIQAGHSYSFNLYAGTSHSALLDSVTVTGVGYNGGGGGPTECVPSQCRSGYGCQCGDFCWPTNRACP